MNQFNIELDSISFTPLTVNQARWGAYFFSSTFEGGLNREGGLKERGGRDLFNLATHYL